MLDGVQKATGLSPSFRQQQNNKTTKQQNNKTTKQQNNKTTKP
jgi:hypothetical protein